MQLWQSAVSSHADAKLLRVPKHCLFPFPVCLKLCLLIANALTKLLRIPKHCAWLWCSWKSCTCMLRSRFRLVAHCHCIAHVVVHPRDLLKQWCPWQQCGSKARALSRTAMLLGMSVSLALHHVLVYTKGSSSVLPGNRVMYVLCL